MTIDITVTALGESVTEATVMRWYKAPGEAVALDETLVELETDKIAVEVKAESAGALAEIVAGEGADVEVGALLGRLEPGASASTAAAEPATRESTDAQEAHAARRTVPARAAARVPPPSPAVRHLLEEHGLDPTQIEGTGKGGRLLKSDSSPPWWRAPPQPGRPSRSRPQNLPNPKRHRPSLPRRSPRPQRFPRPTLLPHARRPPPPHPFTSGTRNACP